MNDEQRQIKELAILIVDAYKDYEESCKIELDEGGVCEEGSSNSEL